jgi:copper chaperone
MINTVIFLILFFLAWTGIRVTLKHISYGCCGNGEESIIRTGPEDTDRTHYRYAVQMKIAGMKCRSCAVRVENALNGITGVWARVNLRKKNAAILMKDDLDDAVLSAVVTAAGCMVNSITGRW